MTAEGATILVVDDEPQNLRLLEAMLLPEDYRVITAANGAEALALVAEEAPALILLDVMMPVMDGYEVARALKAGASTAGIPIVMVSAHTDRGARLRGLEAGAEDFLSKPIDRGELWLRVRNLLRLKELSDQLANRSALLDEQVQERTADLHRLAHYDALTGLPNRMLFFQTLDKTLAVAASRGASVAVAFIDVDHLKNINDTLGHAVGDQLLAQFGDRLTQAVRMRDTVGRLGGDEFAMILTLQNGQQSAAATASRIRLALRKPFDIEGHVVKVTASIGITLYPDDSSEAGALVRYADTAMYRAKNSGRDTFRFFTAQMNDEVIARLDVESALRTAIENDEFVLHYQPKVDLARGAIVGVEALLRWQRPGHGLVSPTEFIPVLEDTGMIVQVGAWVIAEACRQINRWSQSGVGHVPVAVNVAARQLVEGDLNAVVASELRRHNVPAELLELELTESSLMANTERTIDRLQDLRRQGVRISVDDFGTGYSSLAYLRRFPIDKLKIDLSFVRDITTDPDDAAIVLTIIRMAHGLRLDVIAEGVETDGQLSFLRRHRCDQIQGYLFSRPLPALKLGELILSGAGLAPPTDLGGPGNRLLIVDDELGVAERLRQLVHPDGYEILSASSAEQAFEILAEQSVQVILCDPSSATLRESEFLDRVKELHPDALRIVLSANADSPTILAAVNRGAIHRYYTKPWDDTALRRDIFDAFRHYWVLHDDRQERHGPGPRESAHRPEVPRQTVGAARPATVVSGSVAGADHPEASTPLVMYIDGPDIDEVIDKRLITTLFQPVVHLATGHVVGFEALARGPEGTALEMPGALLAAAAEAGRLGELDWVCRTSALSDALGSDLAPSVSWFVNVESAGLASPCPEDLFAIHARARDDLRVILELNERDADGDVTDLLDAADQARWSSWGVAVDDIGNQAMSLALLPLVQPDVVKLDMRALARLPVAAIASVTAGVRAYAERNCAVILAEGVETDADERLAIAYGSTYGQGYRFGHPALLPASLAVPREPVPLRQRPAPPSVETPFGIVSADAKTWRVAKEHLLQISEHLERQATNSLESAVLLACFQRTGFFTADRQAQYEQMSAINAYTVASGVGISESVSAQYRTVTLDAHNRMAHEWVVIFLGPQGAAALAARDCGDSGSDSARRYDFAYTHDHATVVLAARSFLNHCNNPTRHPDVAVSIAKRSVRGGNRLDKPTPPTVPTTRRWRRVTT